MADRRIAPNLLPLENTQQNMVSTPPSASFTYNQLIEPRQVDVLCGRGGMSNHHPGNEWYRRLIRSNRPLYRACPKHTKLLVAKAIVQAVQQQEGRFLERDRETGLWFQVGYRRSVDKTSQGLREKSRDELDGQNATVPESFSGRGKKEPNLHDLAKVAIRHAQSMGSGEKRTTSVPTYGSYSGPAPKRHKTSSPRGTPAASRDSSPLSLSPDEIMSGAAAAASLPSKKPAASSSSKKPAPSRQRKKKSPPPKSPAVAGDSGGSKLGADDVDDLTPLPTTTHIREASMFRFLKHTKLLPTESSKPIAVANSRDLQQYQSQQLQQHQQLQQQQQQLQQQQQEQPPKQLMELSYERQHQQVVEEARRKVQAAKRAAAANPPNTETTNKAARQLYNNNPLFAQSFPTGYRPPQQPQPQLTRFTSQVSDWLNSFWPTEETTSAVAIMNNNNSKNNRQAAAAESTEKQQPLQPPEKKRQFSLTSLVPKRSAGSKRKGAPAIPVLPYGDVVSNINIKNEENSNNGAAYQIPMEAMPSDLETSASATLLKLAATPSKLFSGLTFFFTEGNEAAASKAPQPQQDPLLPPMSSEGSSSKKSKSSLLDDYEESPMEARLRQVEKI